VRLSLVLIFLLVLVVVPGSLAIAILSNFNSVTAKVRAPWLPSTQMLGDFLSRCTGSFSSRW
jgi:hypothetical protein